MVDEEGLGMVGLPMIQAIVKALLATTELLMGEMVGEAMGEVAVGACKVIATHAMASSRAGLQAEIFLVVIVGSSSWLCSSLPLVDQMPNLLLERANR